MTDGSFSSMRVLLDGTAPDTVTCAGAHDQDRIARSAGTKASASALRRELVFSLIAVHPPSTQGWTDPWACVHRVDSLMARRKNPEMDCVTRPGGSCRSGVRRCQGTEVQPSIRARNGDPIFHRSVPLDSFASFQFGCFQGGWVTRSYADDHSNTRPTTLRASKNSSARARARRQCPS